MRRLGRRASRIALFLLALQLAACAPASGPRPVVLVVIDTLRRDHLGLYGHPRSTSPGLDRLARSATVFEQCLAPSSWTKPSSASLLSGLDPLRHKAHRVRTLPAEIPLLAEVLRDAGYDTAAFSGNPYVSPRFGLDRGFATFHDAAGTRPRDYPDAEELLDAARRWLDRPRNAPVFLYLHLMNVHGPYRAPDAYRRRFLPPDHDGSTFPYQGERWQRFVRGDPHSEPTAGERADLQARYEGAIAYSDELLAAFLDELLARRGFDDAVLVVTSDHGEELLDHGGVGHRRTLYAETVNVPLILRDGTDGDGRRVATPVGLIDVPATVLDLLGLLPVDGFGDGVSLTPLLEGRADIARTTPLLATLDEGTLGRAELVQRWPLRLLRIGHDFRGRRNLVELYDEQTDPDELSDLSAERPDELRSLEQLDRLARERLRAGAARAGPDAEIDPELRRRLEALGYVGR